MSKKDKVIPPFTVPLEHTRSVLVGGKWASKLAVDIIAEMFGDTVAVRSWHAANVLA